MFCVTCFYLSVEQTSSKGNLNLSCVHLVKNQQEIIHCVLAILAVMIVCFGLFSLKRSSKIYTSTVNRFELNPKFEIEFFCLVGHQLPNVENPWPKVSIS